MNLLLDKTPDHIIVSGQAVPLKTNFRDWVNFEVVMMGKADNAEKTKCILDITYNRYVDVPEFIDQILWFYRCGVLAESNHKSICNKRIYDFEKDQYMIYTAFRQYYSIDLTTADLHWWIFKQLFLELPEESKMKKVMMYRSISITSSMTKEQRKYYAEMKRVYALPDGRSAEQKAKSYGAILAGGMRIKEP